MEGGNCNSASDNLEEPGEINKCFKQRHQLVLKSLLEKLNLDSNHQRHVVKNVKRLPRKYFENLEERDSRPEDQSSVASHKANDGFETNSYWRRKANMEIETNCKEVPIPQRICTRRPAGPAGELFNPNYNFNRTYNPSSGRTLLESIRNKIFFEHLPTSNDLDADSDWDEEIPNNLPKETRNAFYSNLNKKSKCSLMCKRCEELKFRQQFNRHAETQTTPKQSSMNLKKNLVRQSSSVCTKNLLCNLGFHNGTCSIGSTTSICSGCSSYCPSQCNEGITAGI